jgi:hypothetical protein
MRHVPTPIRLVVAAITPPNCCGHKNRDRVEYRQRQTIWLDIFDPLENKGPNRWKVSFRPRLVMAGSLSLRTHDIVPLQV